MIEFNCRIVLWLGWNVNSMKVLLKLNNLSEPTNNLREIR